MSQTILITGGTGKIGTLLVTHFYKKGFNVLFTALKTTEIETLISQILDPTHHNKLLGIEVDLETDDASLILKKSLEVNHLFPDSTVHTARNIKYLTVPASGLTQRQNLLGEFLLDVIVPYELSWNLVNHPQSQLKNIVIISSIYGVVAPNLSLYENPLTDSPIQYGVAKAAQIHLAKELAIRLANKNVMVNCISYGGIQGRVDEAFKARYAKLCPLGKMLTEDDVIGAVDFLTSGNASHITGQNIIVDGGWTVW